VGQGQGQGVAPALLVLLAGPRHLAGLPHSGNGHPNPGDGEGDLPREAVPATQPQPAPAEAGEQGGEAGQEVPLPVPGADLPRRRDLAANPGEVRATRQRDPQHFFGCMNPPLHIEQEESKSNKAFSYPSHLVLYRSTDLSPMMIFMMEDRERERE